MEICHVCRTNLDEENKWVDGLCNNCASKIHSNRYTVVICNKHNLPQGLFLRSLKDKKPYPDYYFIDKCNLEIESLLE